MLQLPKNVEILTWLTMEHLEQYKGLVELKVCEMRLISGGSGFMYRLGQAAHRAYCYVRDWAATYEGDPYIRQKMGGL